MSQKNVLVRVVGKHFFQSVSTDDPSVGAPDLIRHEINAVITVPDHVQKAQPFRLELVGEYVPVSATSEPEIQTSTPPQPTETIQPEIDVDELVEAVSEEIEEEVVEEDKPKQIDEIATAKVKTKSNLFDEFAPEVEKEEIVTGLDGITSIRELPLPPNQLSVLWKHGFKTVEDLGNISDEDLLAIKGIGKSSVQKIRIACSDL